MSAATPLDGLVDAHAHSRVSVYLSEVWDRRSYIWYVAQSELRHRQINTVLGSLWYLLNPILSISVYFLIFGVVLQTDRGMSGVGEYLLFLTVGLFVFQFTQRSVMQGGNSVVSNRGLVRAIRFPRALLPISTTLTEALAVVPAFVVMYAVAFTVGEPIEFRWLLIPVIAAWQVVFNLGLAFFSARLTTQIGDMQQVLPFAFRLLLYASGVLFSVEDYVSDRTLELVFLLNPLYGFISMSRWAIMGREVAIEVIVASIVWTIALVIVGFFWFRSAEHAYDRV